MTNSSPEKKFHANLTDLLTSICASTTELWFLSRPMVHITAWVSLCCSISRHVRCPGLTLTPPIPKACIKRLKIMSYCSRIICHLYYDSLCFFFLFCVDHQGLYRLGRAQLVIRTQTPPLYFGRQIGPLRWVKHESVCFTPRLLPVVWTSWRLEWMSNHAEVDQWIRSTS